MTERWYSCILVMLGISVIMVGSLAYAQPVKVIESWSLFVTKEKKEKLCYVAGVPASTHSAVKKHHDPYFIVTYKGPHHDEISVSSGYVYKHDNVTITVGKKNYQLFTKDQVAWTQDAKDDASVVQHLLKGGKLVVHGERNKKIHSEETYALKGFKEAYTTMHKACGPSHSKK